jgi:RNA polymerase sigma-70 factor, ECF subfamily
MNDDELPRLYKMYGPYIYARCCKMLRDRAAAEDATQETFLRVQRHLATLPPSSNEALAWIYRVATNYCLNELRNRNRRAEPRDDLPEDAPSFMSTSPDPIDRSEARIADRELARRLIDDIPAKLRSVAWLYHVDDLDQQEIADVLGISRRTVVTRLQQFFERAQKLMRRLA